MAEQLAEVVRLLYGISRLLCVLIVLNMFNLFIAIALFEKLCPDERPNATVDCKEKP